MATTQHVEPKLPYEGKFWMLVAPPVRHYIKKLYGSELTRKAYKGGKPLYRELIDRAPAIGAGNPMATNLYLACVVFAMWKACDGELTPDMVREVLRALFASRVVRSATVMEWREEIRCRTLERACVSLSARELGALGAVPRGERERWLESRCPGYGRIAEEVRREMGAAKVFDCRTAHSQSHFWTWDAN